VYHAAGGPAAARPGPAVVYDLVGFQSRDHGDRGIARYVLQLGLALERIRPGLVTQWLARPDLPFPTGAELLLSTGRVTRADRWSEGRSPTAGGVFIAGSPFECMHLQSELVLPSLARTANWRRVVVVHDLIPAIFPELYLKSRAEANYYAARMTTLAAFDRFLTDSQATANDLIDMVEVDPDHVTVIGAGADDSFRRPADGPEQVLSELIESRAVPGLRPEYVLFPTGIDPRKNINRTLQAYGRLPSELRRRHQLVMVCRMSESDRKGVLEVAREAGLKSELLLTGYVDDDVLRKLYQAAHLVIFPSYYEGFGLPALEAMQCGAPVLCADATSLKEVQPLREARFDPMSVPKMAGAIERALADDDLRRRLRKQKPPAFSWELAAELTAGVVDEQLEWLGRRRSSVGPARPRLALISPLPPQPTGVAAYAYRLLEELRHHCDVTVFVDGDPAQVWAPQGVEIAPVNAYQSLVAGGAAFDRTVYFLGNSQFHAKSLALLERHPGPVVFHDVRLTELYRELHRLHPDQLVDQSVGATVAALYPERYRAEIQAMKVIDQDTANRFGLLMTRQVVEWAESALVHSHHAASLLELDAECEPIVIHPLPCPDKAGYRSVPKPEERARPVRQPVIATFGVVSPSRGPEQLIDALAVLVSPEARTERSTDELPTLRFVGPVEDRYQDALLARAEQLGVADRVELTGQLNDRRFTLAQADATVAVQLRTFSNGESPAVVTELLAQGTPTVVSDLGSMSELADDVVVKVPLAADAATLAQAIGRVLDDGELRSTLSARARAYASQHTFAGAAQALIDHIFGSTDSTDIEHRPTGPEPAELPCDRPTDLPVVLPAPDVGDHQILTRLYTGQPIYVDARDASLTPTLVLDGRWEPETTDTLLQLLDPADCVIDVGASYGYFGLVAGNVIEQEAGGSVHLIDANPRMAELAAKSLEAAGLGPIGTVTDRAVSDTEGEIDLRVPAKHWGQAHLDGSDQRGSKGNGQGKGKGKSKGKGNGDRPEPIDEELVMPVPAITLDHFAETQGIDRVDLVKLDVEGHEAKAYQGMAQIIDRNRDRLRLLLTFSPERYGDAEGFFEQIKGDFKFVYGIGGAGRGPTELCTYDDVAGLTTGPVTLLASNSEFRRGGTS
jgi:FkbM family methyltransferase